MSEERVNGIIPGCTCFICYDHPENQARRRHRQNQAPRRRRPLLDQEYMTNWIEEAVTPENDIRFEIEEMQEMQQVTRRSAYINITDMNITQGTKEDLPDENF